MPLATSQLIIENEFVPDLPEELWNGDEITASITRAGKHLDELDLLPSPFPLEDYLSPERLPPCQADVPDGWTQLRQCQRPQGRHSLLDERQRRRQEQAGGVGREILLVTDYIPERRAMRLSVPPNVTPRRVSVDAIEHWMIYREHPSVGAILHIHAWMNGIKSTHINYPCGTFELAETVADLVRQEPDPGHAVIGLAQPWSDDHRREPGRDLCPHRRQDPAPGSDELTPMRALEYKFSLPSYLAVRAADRLPLPMLERGTIPGTAEIAPGAKSRCPDRNGCGLHRS